MRTLDAGLAVPTPLRRDGLGVLLIDVGQTGLDEVFSPVVELPEVVRGVQDRHGWLEPEPAHIVHDRVDVLAFLGVRVGVIQAQVAHAAELLRDTEVDADGLGVPDVQVPVGLGRKPGLHPPAERIRSHVRSDPITHEIAGGGEFFGRSHARQGNTSRKGVIAGHRPGDRTRRDPLMGPGSAARAEQGRADGHAPGVIHHRRDR